MKAKEKKEHAVKFAKYVVDHIYGGDLTINELRIDLFYTCFLNQREFERKA